ncbi:MAG: methylated-DNA--[protein]-cysteine S-methyltransferase [Sphingobacteriaceae bacterium]|nr:methylated-DNA--[protein]-cysteine S-methyltransferase [Cytophagaceae bacterium]
MPDFITHYDSPLGRLEIWGTETHLSAVLFAETKKRPHSPRPATETSSPPLRECIAQLKAYFAGTLHVFDLPLQPQGTEFQRKVWTELGTIPFGKTQSYLQLARALGDEKCIRAAASANGHNPLSIVIPCHRVIGSDGKLVGYGGDLWRKRWLLEHEQTHTIGKWSLF